MKFLQQHKSLVVAVGIAIVGIVVFILLQNYGSFLGARVSTVALSQSVVGGRLNAGVLATGNHTLQYRAKTADGKIINDTVAFNVAHPLPTVQITVNGQHNGGGAYGMPATISWTSANVASCVASSTPASSWAGAKQVNGTFTEQSQPLTTQTTFKIRCDASQDLQGAFATDSASVTVGGNETTNPTPTPVPTPTPTIAPLPTLTFTVTPHVVGGTWDYTAIQWVFSGPEANGKYCQASGGWSGAKPLSGNVQVPPSSATQTTYNMTCYVGGGSDAFSTAQGTVYGSGAPNPTSTPVPTVSLQQAAINGTNFVLTYSKSFATCLHLYTEANALISVAQNYFCDAGNNISITAPISSIPVTAGARIKACDGNSGVNLCSNVVTVGSTTANTTTPTLTFTVTPHIVGGNWDYTAIDWNYMNGVEVNGRYCEASGGWSGGLHVSGHKEVPPTTTQTTYNIKCYAGGGSESFSTAQGTVR